MHAPPRHLPSGRLTSAALALLLLAGALLMVLLAGPAAAAERVVTITPQGLEPAVLQIRPGDRVTFAVRDAPLDGFQVRSTSPSWPEQFDVRIGGLLNPESFTVPQALSRPGTYTYDAISGDTTRQGSVVIPAPQQVSPAPSQPASPAPQPTDGAGVPPASPPADTGGTGSTAPPPLTGGFGSLQLPSPSPAGDAPVPMLAVPLPTEPSAGPSPSAAAIPQAAPPTSRAVAGDLVGAETLRGYGLPATLAAVLAAGIGSLLVRVLLAEPAARRLPSMRRPVPVATVD